jgi:hypothetical protein
MLLYDVGYLAHTQSIEIPSHRRAMRSEIYGRCVVAANWDGTSSSRFIFFRLGFYSALRVSRRHETTPSLPPLMPTSFSLDFAQVLQATTASPARGRPRVALAGMWTGMMRDTMAGAGAERRSLSRTASDAETTGADRRGGRVSGGGRRRARIISWIVVHG